MNIFKQLLAKQLGHNWQDRSVRGHGNRAARRAFAAELKSDPNLRSNLCEPIAQYPGIITHGAILTDCCTDQESAKYARWA